MPIFWFIFLFFFIIAKIGSYSNLIQTFYGQILSSTNSPDFNVQVKCDNCQEKVYKTISSKGEFEIAMTAEKEDERIGKITVQIQSAAQMGKHQRSNEWEIVEPKADKTYKFFFGHYNPNPPSFPSKRLSLHGKFIGQLPRLADPGTCYGVLLRKYDKTSGNETDRHENGQQWSINANDQNVFSKIFMDGQGKDGAKGWTNDGKGFELWLEETGIKYMREKQRPAMELLLVTAEDCTKTSFLTNARPRANLTHQQELDNQQNPSPYAYYTNEEMNAQRKDKGSINRIFQEAWTPKWHKKTVNFTEPMGKASATDKGYEESVKSPNVLNEAVGGKNKGKNPRRKDAGGGTITNESHGEEEEETTEGNSSRRDFNNVPHSNNAYAEDLISPNGSPLPVNSRGGTEQPTTLIRNFGVKKKKFDKFLFPMDGSEKEKMQKKVAGCCFTLPKLSFKSRRSSSERSTNSLPATYDDINWDTDKAVDIEKEHIQKSNEENDARKNKETATKPAQEEIQQHINEDNNYDVNSEHNYDYQRTLVDSNLPSPRLSPMVISNLPSDDLSSVSDDSFLSSPEGPPMFNYLLSSPDLSSVVASPAELSPMRQRPLLRNQAQREISVTIKQSLSGQNLPAFPSEANRRSKRFNDNSPGWSLTKNAPTPPTRSTKNVRVTEVLLTVRIGMPVLMKYGIDEQQQEPKEDYFMYSFKLPPPNEIEEHEVNRQQMREEEREEVPKEKSATINRNKNNASKMSTPMTSRTTSSSSVFSRAGNSYSDSNMAAQIQREVMLAKMGPKKQSAEKQAKLDPLNGDKFAKNGQKIKQNSGESESNELNLQFLGGQRKGILKKRTENVTKTPSTVPNSSSLLGGVEIVKKNDQKQREKQKGIEIKETEKVPKKAEKGEDNVGKGKQIVEDKAEEEEKKKRPKKKKEIPKNGQTQGQTSNLEKEKSEKKSQKMEDNLAEQKPKGEEESMDKIWEKIKQNGTKEEQQREEGKKVREEKQSEEGRASDGERGDKLGNEQKESKMLQEIKQKRGKLKEVSPKKREKSERQGIVVESTEGSGKLEGKNEDNFDDVDAALHHLDIDEDLAQELKKLSKEQIRQIVKEMEQQKTKQQKRGVEQQQQQDQQLNNIKVEPMELHLTEAEFDHLRELMAGQNIAERVSEHELNKLNRIASLLMERLEPNPKADPLEGINTKQFEQLFDIYQRLNLDIGAHYEEQQQQQKPISGDDAFNNVYYHNDTINEGRHSSTTKRPQNDAFVKGNTISEEEEESEPQPLIRKKKKSQIIGTHKNSERAEERIGQMKEENPAQMSGQTSHVGQEEDEELFENESTAAPQVYQHENLFRMVKEDIETMKSDAESRDKVDKKQQKLNQKEEEKSLKEWVEKLVNGLKKEEFDLLEAVLEKFDMENGTEPKRAPKSEREEQQIGTKEAHEEHTTEGEKHNFHSDIDIKTDSELHKKRPPKVPRRKKSSKGIDAKHTEQKGEDKLITPTKVEENGQKRASYSEWKKMENEVGKRPTIEDQDFEDFFTPKPSPSPLVLTTEAERQSWFLSGHLDKFSSMANWMRGMAAQSSGEQDTEQESNLKKLGTQHNA